MNRAERLDATSEVPLWWCDDGQFGFSGYIGAGYDGIQMLRHHDTCAPGKWRVGLTGWGSRPAVIDDFGNLREVRQ